MAKNPKMLDKLVSELFDINGESGSRVLKQFHESFLVNTRKKNNNNNTNPHKFTKLNVKILSL